MQFYPIHIVIYVPFCISLANVDPVDIARSIKDLDPETTLGNYHLTSIFIICMWLMNICWRFPYFSSNNCAVVVVSKTFTTAETMLNARTLKEWIISSLGSVLVPERSFVTHYLNLLWLSYKIWWFRPQTVSKHMIAVSTNLKVLLDPFFPPWFYWILKSIMFRFEFRCMEYVMCTISSNLLEYFKRRFWYYQFPTVPFLFIKLVKEFGIDPNNAFAFWDWVGGRYSGEILFCIWKFPP